MARRDPSSLFTTSPPAEKPFGPPLIGALLRMPWEAVQRHMLDRLHEHGREVPAYTTLVKVSHQVNREVVADLDFAHLNVFQYPGPQGARPSELAARLRISKQALNYLLGELEPVMRDHRLVGGDQRLAAAAAPDRPALPLAALWAAVLIVLLGFALFPAPAARAFDASAFFFRFAAI